MKAMILRVPGQPLQLDDVPSPSPEAGQVLIKVHACGVCRTDLHIIDGELAHPRLPLILGHQIVGRVVEVGSGVSSVHVGQRVGVPWLGATCGACEYCQQGRENLCEHAQFTGYDRDGGFAEYTVADARYCLPIPDAFPDLQAAPLLCAGLIGFRSLRMAGHPADTQRLGLYGFGAAAHIVIQVARHYGQSVYAFTRPGDLVGQAYARSLGAVWAGPSDQRAPDPLHAAIIFAPAGELVPAALRATGRGGIVVCAGIHMSEIPPFPYEILWHERQIRSVANLTRDDGDTFLRLAPTIPIRTTVTCYPLEAANQALDDLRAGRLSGAAVLHLAS